MLYSREVVSGSIESFVSNSNLYGIDLHSCNAVSGDIEIACINWYWVNYVVMHYLPIDNIHNQIDPNNWGIRSTNIYGNISVFGNKYDSWVLHFGQYSSINGDASSLKNLKKLRYFHMYACNCTGSKSDLWNNGADMVDFRI